LTDEIYQFQSRQLEKPNRLLKLRGNHQLLDESNGLFYL
jgi:hypothetical protein